MRRERHSPDEAEAELASRTAPGQVCERLGVSEATCHRRKKQYGGGRRRREASAEGEVRRLKELEKENARLKRQAMWRR